MTGIKTTKRNYLWTIQKKVGNNWRMITESIFTKRSNARECVRELSSATGMAYRVRKMVIMQPAKKVSNEQN